MPPRRPLLAVLFLATLLSLSTYVAAIGIDPPAGRVNETTGETLYDVDGVTPLAPQRNGVDIPNFQNIAFFELQYVSITKIDGVEQSFTSDFYMYTIWAAPKAPTWTGNDDLNDADTIQKQYWFPQLDFINAIGGVTTLVDTPYSFISEDDLYANNVNLTDRHGFVLPDGWTFCVCDQRYVAAFLTPVSMQKFPYDQQRALLLIESFWTTDALKMQFAKPERIVLDHLFPPTMPDILGWNPVRADSINHDITYQYTNTIYNRQELAIVMNRIPDFFINKLVSGCVMLIGLSVSLFLLTAEEADRLMGALAIFAGLIAYLFVASVYTPVLPYSTALDQFLLLCFVHVVAQSCVHGVMFYAREREKLKEEQEEQEKEEAAMNESDDDEDDEEEGEEAIAVKPYAQKAVHAIAIQQGNGRNNASHSSSPNEQAATEMVVVAPNDAARKSHSVNAVAPAPHETDAFPASPSVAQHDHHHHAHGGVSARSRHGTVPPLEAAEGEKPKKMNKRDRKRLRKKQAMAATNAARQEAIQRVQITNSFNPVRMWWASLGLTTIRKWDVFWFVFFTASFIVATAVIFGVADTH